METKQFCLAHILGESIKGTPSSRKHGEEHGEVQERCLFYLLYPKSKELGQPLQLASLSLISLPMLLTPSSSGPVVLCHCLGGCCVSCKVSESSCALTSRFPSRPHECLLVCPLSSVYHMESLSPMTGRGTTPCQFCVHVLYPFPGCLLVPLCGGAADCSL